MLTVEKEIGDWVRSQVTTRGHQIERLKKKCERLRTNPPGHNNVYKTYAVLLVLKVRAVKFR